MYVIGLVFAMERNYCGSETSGNASRGYPIMLGQKRRTESPLVVLRASLAHGHSAYRQYAGSVQGTPGVLPPEREARG